jgi:hypothetical protein
VTAWSAANNPFFGGERADALALIPFAVILAVLLRAGLPHRAGAS